MNALKSSVAYKYVRAQLSDVTVDSITSPTAKMLLIHFLIICVVIVGGSNILVLTPITAPSHSNFFKPIVKELASRGHTVTYWNGLKPGPRVDNVRQLYSDTLGLINSDHQITFNDRDKALRLFLKFYDRTVAYCTAIFEDPIFHQLMTTDEQFDLVLVDGVLNECVMPLIGAIKVPFIYMNTQPPAPWLLDAIGSPQGYAYFPNAALCFSDQMDVWQRTLNTIAGAFLGQFRKWVMMPTVDRIAYRMLQNYTIQTSASFVEDKYLSLLITNTHFAINYEQPSSPAIVEAGGLHCTPSKPLPKVIFSFQIW